MDLLLRVRGGLFGAFPFLMVMEQEIWKDVVGWERLYRVSSIGRVMSVRRVSKRGNNFIPVKEKILKQFLDTHGYCTVGLCDKENNRNKKVRVHQLVAKAFIDNPQNKPFVDHINTIKTDNTVENLRWVTYKENANNPITLERVRKNGHGLSVSKKNMETRKANGKYNAPMEVFQYTLDNVYVTSFESISEAERITHIKNIKKVIHGKRHTAGGYRWYSKRIEPTQ